MRAIHIPAGPAAGHAAPITNVALRPDGQALATASYDGTALIWDLAAPGTPRPVTSLAHRRLVNAVAWNPADTRLLATASADKTAVVWDVSGRHARIVSVLARHTDDINAVAWLPDGERLACVSEDGQATLWDARRGRFLSLLVSHAAHCMMVAASSGGLIATVGEDGMIAVTDPDAGLLRSRDCPASVEGCAWSHSGQLLAVARDDGRVDVLDQDLAQVRSIPVASSAARAVAWSDDDRLLFAGAYDGKVHVVGADGQRLGAVEDERLWPRAISAAAGLLAVGSFWSAPFLLDQATREPLAVPARPTHGPNAMVARGERELLIGTDSGRILSAGIPAPGGDEIPPPASSRSPAAAVTRGPILSLAASGSEIAVGTYAGRIGLVRPGQPGGRFGATVGAPLPAILGRDGMIVAGTYDGELVAVDRGSLDPLCRTRAHDGSIKALAALDADCFVSGATDHAVAVGDLRQRQVLWTHGNLVNSVAVLPGPGRAVVASASRDHTVKVGWITRERGGWQVSRLETLIGPDESVKCVGLLGTADAPVVLAGSYDFGLYAWSLGREPASPALRDGVLVSSYGQGLSCICPIGRRMAAAAGWDGRVAIFGLDGQPPGRPVREIGSFLVPDLIGTAEAGAVA
jgi:toxoflavin biosynthesis protein ToxC